MALLLALYTLSALAAKPVAMDSDSKSPFVLPKEFAVLLKDYRKNWKRMTAPEPSALHWNQKIVVYTSKGQEVYENNHKKHIQALRDDSDNAQGKPGFLSYPVGTVLLKENYFTAGGEVQAPASIALMIKREKGYDNTMGDWQFVQFDPSGRLMVSGNSKNTAVANACTQCHQGMAMRDYVFSTYFASPTGAQ